MIWLLPVVVMYLFLMIWWARVWKNIPLFEPLNDATISVTVITAMRNESGQIAMLIRSLQEQELSGHQWTFILIDDHSTDDSLEEARYALTQTTLTYKIHSLPQGLSGKKDAIQYGVEQADTDWIITTDADCTMGRYWLSTLLSSIDEKTKMITGPVRFKQKATILNRFLELDLMSMIGIGAVTLNTGIPLLNNAANMGFHRETFLELNPYVKNKKASGDDIFLLKKLHRAYPDAIKFVKSGKAMVTSMPPLNFREFINQRIRWASKTSSTVQNVIESVIVALIYGSNVIALIIPIAALVIGSWSALITAISIVAIKVLADMIFFRTILPFFKVAHYLKFALVAEILHIPYVVLFGLSGLRGTYQWKSRKLR